MKLLLLTAFILLVAPSVHAGDRMFCYTSKPMSTLSQARQTSLDLMGSALSIKTMSNHTLKGWRVWMPDTLDNKSRLIRNNIKFFRVRLKSGTKGLSVGFFSMEEFSNNYLFKLVDEGYPARLTQTWEDRIDSYEMHVRADYELNDNRMTPVHCAQHILYSPGSLLVAEFPPPPETQQVRATTP